MEEETTAVVEQEATPEIVDATESVVHEEPQDPTELEIDDLLAEFNDVKGELSENEGSLITTKTEETDEEEAVEEKQVEVPLEEVKEQPVEEVVAEEPATDTVYDETVQDPGEFTPGDYGFTIQLTDGKTYNVKNLEDVEAVADLVDENPELMTAKTLIQFNRNVTKMENSIEADQAKYNEQKQAWDSQQELVQKRDETLLQINNGINYLEQKGLLPKIDDKLNTTDVKWEEHADEPGIKERLELLKYMDKENEARIAAGLDPNFDIVSAFNGMRLEMMQQQEVAQDKQEKEDRRKAGARVTGASKNVQTTSRRNEIVGAGGSLDELLAEYY